MIDREKVITGLECCSVKQSCLECPWQGIDCNDRLHLAALELLKEQQETIASLQGTICKLNAALAEQPEQKHGHWIIEDDPKSNWIRVTCSECKENVTSTMQLIGFYPNYEALWDYCPYCGAKMDEEVKQNG